MMIVAIQRCTWRLYPGPNSPQLRGHLKSQRDPTHMSCCGRDWNECRFIQQSNQPCSFCIQYPWLSGLLRCLVCEGSRGRSPVQRTWEKRFYGDDLFELVPWSLQHSPYMTLATISASWFNLSLLVLGRERQYSSLNTITCEPRPFSIRF